ncbi:MAG: LCP family protein [bacterium]|nr:LCP family protein [bacterium]
MKKIEINLLHLEQQKYSSQFTKPLPTQNIFPIVVKVILVAVAILSATAVLSFEQTKDANSAISKTFNSLIQGSLPQFGYNPDRNLAGEIDDRVNILLLGVGGKSHDGAQLSDTNIVLSIQPSSKKVAFISIPRDLLVPIEGYGWRKVNNANAFGEQEKEGSGPQRAVDVFSKVLNIPIQYYVRVDFSAFSQIVDTLGGITVNVDNAFTDYTYPTENYKFQTLVFKQGAQTMDGDRALKYARSRHSGMNNEGSDFARSKRQQKVLAAIKEKLFSTDFLLNPQKISDVTRQLQDNILTNVSPWQGLRLLAIIKNISDDAMIHLGFDDGPNNYLIASSVAGAYVLQPKDGTFESMQSVVQNIFNATSTPSEKEAIQSEAPRVIIRNGTSIAGLATKYADTLVAMGYRVVAYGNAKEKNTGTTTMYTISSPAKQKSSDALTNFFHARQQSSGWNTADIGSIENTDFLIVLGDDAASTPLP